MLNKKRLFVTAAFGFVSFLGVSAANAQNVECPYTLASLQGNYAVIGIYGNNVAMALGVRSLDGNGNLKGTSVINEPTAGSTTGARTVVTVANVGTYTVNCDGTGTVTRVATTTTGIVVPAVDDFVITGAVRASAGTGTLVIATTIVDAQEIPSGIVPGGVFLTRAWTRLPDIMTNWRSSMAQGLQSR